MDQNKLEAVCGKYQESLIEFAQEIVRIRSYSSEEGRLAEFIRRQMLALGYDEVYIDSIGNVVGRIGSGQTSIMLDSHMDTVEVQDPDKWDLDPFGAEIKDGRIWGRGSVDMKSALASSVYAPLIARGMGWMEGRTVYITCTVNEEDCDGQNLKSLFAEKHLRPDYFITCEPSSNEIALGHTGKAQIRIRTKGKSAAACRPQNGVNAVYKMREIIGRVEALNEALTREGEQLHQPHGTVILSDISCVSASYNAVPSECEIYLDRRMVLGETAQKVRDEMDALVAGTDAVWEVGTLYTKSWTGQQIAYEPFHEAWQIDPAHPLTQACLSAYEEVFGRPHGPWHVWVGGTNAVTPVSMGIPCIGFGPGEDYLSHVANENCIVSEIIDAARYYAVVIRKLA